MKELTRLCSQCLPVVSSAFVLGTPTAIKYPIDHSSRQLCTTSQNTIERTCSNHSNQGPTYMSAIVKSDLGRFSSSTLGLKSNTVKQPSTTVAMSILPVQFHLSVCVAVALGRVVLGRFPNFQSMFSSSRRSEVLLVASPWSPAANSWSEFFGVSMFGTCLPIC
jgi:hypothetical protein